MGSICSYTLQSQKGFSLQIAVSVNDRLADVGSVKDGAIV